VVTKEFSLHEALTKDKHFREAGFRFFDVFSGYGGEEAQN
jgi:hypothetical protein